jgi:hypothetical protein
MKRLARIHTLALIALLILTSCVSSGYAAASQAYDIDSQAYLNAGNAVQAHSLTPEQNARFMTAQAEVRAADNAVHAALTSWRASNVKPADFDALAATLRSAQQKVINLASEVSK